MSVKIGRNDPCWCGSGRKYKTCHQSFDEKIEKYREAGCIVPTHDLIKTPKDIEGIRESAKINVAVLDYVAEHRHLLLPLPGAAYQSRHEYRRN